MSQKEFTDAELEAYLDEDLPSVEMAEIEDTVRDANQRTVLIDRLTLVNRRRDSGIHSLGEIWRRHRISCPHREMLGRFLLGVLSKDETDYIEFHTQRLGCRQCQANLDDLQSQQKNTDKDAAKMRQRKYFQTSAGYLSQRDD